MPDMVWFVFDYFRAQVVKIGGGLVTSGKINSSVYEGIILYNKLSTRKSK